MDLYRYPVRCPECNVYRKTTVDGLLYRHSKGGRPYSKGGVVCIGSGVNPYSDVVPESLAEDVHVRYTYDQDARPNLACPHCEATSETLKEPVTLAILSGNAGVITEIEDPHDEEDAICRACRKSFKRPSSFSENGIALRFRTIKAGFGGVWAYPSEVTIISEREFMGAGRA